MATSASADVSQLGAGDPHAVAAAVAQLGADDPRAVAAAVAQLELGPVDADALFAAGRACEDKLVDPGHALAIYERIVRSAPDARVAVAAARRIERLRDELGAHGEHATEAAALAHLVADADTLTADDVVHRADALSDAAWPGAADAALWLAEWLRRHGRFEDAQVRYARITSQWPDSPQAALARRDAAGCAIDARDWATADSLARLLPVTEPADRVVRDKLLDAAARGRFRARLYSSAWFALALALLTLCGSLIEAARRDGWRRPSLRPPIEVMFLAPVATVLVVVSFTAHRAIAPAVTRISIVGIALAWLSGTALDLLRVRGRSVRLRAVLHVLACTLGVAAIGYIAMTRDGLLDLLLETVRFGPES